MAAQDIRLLVLGVGGNVSQGIVKSIRKSNLKVEIYGACVDPKSAGLYFCDQALISPMASDLGFVDWLLEICNQYQITGILSGVEPVLQQLSANQERIESDTSARVIVSSPTQLEICGDKLRTASWLESHSLNFPATADSGDLSGLNDLVRKNGYPLLAKPRAGKSSIGVHVIHSDDELGAIANTPDYVVQQYLGTSDSEYTASTFTDRQQNIRGCIIFKRHLQSGTTVCAEVVNASNVREEVLKIADRLGPVGPCNIQLRQTERGPTCFEINLRYSGTTPIRASFGFNDVESGIRNLILQEEIQDLPIITDGIAMRYWNEVYFKPSAYETLSEHRKLSDPVSNLICTERFGVKR